MIFKATLSQPTSVLPTSRPWRGEPGWPGASPHPANPPQQRSCPRLLDRAVASLMKGMEGCWEQETEKDRKVHVHGMLDVRKNLKVASSGWDGKEVFSRSLAQGEGGGHCLAVTGWTRIS